MRDWNKKLISCLVTVFMIIGGLSGITSKMSVVKADGENPELINISLDSSQVQKGEKVRVNVTVDGKQLGIDYIDVRATALFGEHAGEEAMLGYYSGSPVFSGTKTIEIETNNNIANGVYQISSIQLGDVSGNSVFYYTTNWYGPPDATDSNQGTYIEERQLFISNTISNNGINPVAAPSFVVTGDDVVINKPQLTGISVLNSQISRPGNAQIELSVSDVDNDASYACVRYIYHDERVCESADVPIELYASPSDNKFIIDIPFKNTSPLGTYQIDSVTLGDSDNNYSYYNIDPMESNIEESAVSGKEGTYLSDYKIFVPNVLRGEGATFTAPIFELTGTGTQGNSYPVLKGIRLISDSVKRPGVAKIQLDIHDDYGIDYAYVDFIALQGNNIGDDMFCGEYSGTPIKDGTITLNVSISENKYLGKYQPWIVTLSNVNNLDTSYTIQGIWSNCTPESIEGMSGTYDADTRTFVSNTLAHGTEIFEAPILTLVDINDYSARTSILNPNLLKIIENTPDGKSVGVFIDSNSSGILPKAAFDNIKGRNVWLVAYKESYQWVFYGKDITGQTKDVNLLIDVDRLSETIYDTSEDVINVSFKPNGQLPGKTTVRIKSDYLYSLNGMKGNLYLYYNNNGIMELQNNPGFGLELDGSDKWCSFDITHNSNYVISGSKVGSKKHTSKSTKKNTKKSTTPKYSNEWVKGKWYDKNGKQTYSGTLSWKCNSTGWWIEDTTGWYPISQWQKIDGVWYYFNTSGYMASNEYYNGYWLNGDGSWDDQYYLSWKCNSTGWWVEDKSGWWPSSRWLKIDGCWYYFNGSGYMATSQYVDGWWVGANGACQ